MPEPTMAILWDNGAPTPNSNLASSQLDAVYPFISQVADDFIFEEDTEISDVHWWGGFWNGPPDEVDPCEFNIYFYADDGTGGAPTGSGSPDPSPTALATYNFPSISGKPVNPDGFYEYNVDLDPPFIAVAGEKHWIAIQAVFPFPPQWGWADTATTPQLSPAVQGFPLLGTTFWTVMSPEVDMAFYLTGGAPVPDLDCDGSLSWVDVEAGSTVTGDFALGNIGEAGSILNWKVKDYPAWGTWTFTPETGAQPVGWITVDVTVVAPSEKNKNFTGKVVLENTDDPSDVCVIDVLLATPKAKQFNFNMNLINWLFEHFPILKFVLGI